MSNVVKSANYANRTEYLEALVIRLATLYDRGEDCVDFDGNLVSNSEYDAYVRELRKLSPNSKAFARGTTSPSEDEDDGDVVIHDPPMTSIAKVDGEYAEKEKKYRDWRDSCVATLGYDPNDESKFAQSYKHDGVAIRINYKDGKLVSAGLRPKDGIHGIDVTVNVKYVKGVPETLPLPLTLSIGGELECLLEDFKKVNEQLEKAGEELRANPRNHTVGVIRQVKDPSKTKEGRIGFIGYNINNLDNWQQYYLTEVERAKWVNTVLKVPFIQVRPHRFQDLKMMEENVPNLPYEVDGIVLKVNDLEDQEQLGHHGDDPIAEPRGAIAWKFEEENAIAEVDNIEWDAGRSGHVTPVANFKTPVQLAGTKVSRATCSNIGWLRRLEIGPGSQVKVIKAGKIIPKIIEVVSGNVPNIAAPKNCPACKKDVVVRINPDSGNLGVFCLNDDCLAKQTKRIDHYLKNIGAKGLGISKIERIVDSGLVKDMADFYVITPENLVDSAGFSEREALLAVATIHLIKPNKDNDELKKKIAQAQQGKQTVPAWQFFAALGIPSAGKTLGRLLVDRLGSFDKIMDATAEELERIPGVGEVCAKSISEFFQKNHDYVTRLLEHVELELPKVGKLSGKTFVFTGTFDEGKDYWRDRVRNLGAKTSDSVGKSTDFVVAGPKAGSKLDKAKQLNITILDVEGLKKLL